MSRRHVFSATNLPLDIGQTLKALRHKKRWSQAELASRAQITRETIICIEKEGGRLPRADTALRLLEVLLADHVEPELNNYVPDWPEADGTEIVGHGPRTRARRRQLKLKAADVAAIIGVSEATLSRFERNACPTPSLLRSRMTPLGDEIFYLRNARLAGALKFRDLEDHEAFCWEPDWRNWKVAEIEAEEHCEV